MDQQGLGGGGDGNGGGEDILPEFHRGGSIIVGGPAGRDNIRVAFNAEQGERVDILTQQQQRQQANSNQEQPVNVTIILDGQVIQRSLGRGMRRQGARVP